MKRRAAEFAADLLEDGMVVGLGTGSTAGFAIDAIGRAVDGGLDVTGIPTSYQSRSRARSVGIPLTGLDAVEGIDLAIDGADQVADEDLVKGGGAAHAREKIVASAADRFVVVIDPSKETNRLSRPVPLEVLPSATSVVRSRVRELGGAPELRAAKRKDGPVVTDNGNLVLDCDFGPIDDPNALSASLDSLPGVLAQGLFVEMVDDVVIGESDGVRTRRYG